MKKTLCIAILLLGLFHCLQAQIFIGINAGAGLEGTTGNTSGITLGVGTDIGFINTSVGMWGLSASRHLSLGTANHTDFGILHLPQDWHKCTAFLWGAGLDIRSAMGTPYGQSIEDDGTLRRSIGYRDNMGFGVMLRIGVSSPKHFYLSGSIAVGAFTSNKDTYTLTHTASGLHYNGFASTTEDRSYLTLGIHIGYRF